MIFLVFAHCEDINLVHGGCIMQVKACKALGLPGISNAVGGYYYSKRYFACK